MRVTPPVERERAHFSLDHRAALADGRDWHPTAGPPVPRGRAGIWIRRTPSRCGLSRPRAFPRVVNMPVEWVTFDCYETLIDCERGITDALLPLLSPGTDRRSLAEWYISMEAQ